MSKIKDPALFKTIKEFVTNYLLEVRCKSRNTVISYKAAINLYLSFLECYFKKSLSDVKSSDFNAQNFRLFMNWLTTERNNSATTVNLRLTHVRQFCKYLQKCGLVSFSDYAETKELSMLPDARKKDFIFLSIEEMKKILEVPDISKKSGLRDKFYIALLYDSGCRDQEILDLQIKNFIIRNDGKAELQVIGKGNKYRVTPISEEVTVLFKKYCKEYHADSSEQTYLFYTLRKGIISKMSDDNVARFLNKYEKILKEEYPDLPHLHAHLFRRSRAMHLYGAGVPLPLISEWLGHSQIETTQIYARASLDMKREAAETLKKQSGSIFSDEKFKYDDDDIIKRLYGLA